MENEALEMHGAAGPKEEFQGKPGIPSTLKIFLLCLLASLLTTAVTILALALIGRARGAEFPKNPAPAAAAAEESGKSVEAKFQFLHHLSKAKLHQSPGGEMQWARFRENLREYEKREELEFGQSIHERRAGISAGTLRIRPRGLWVPHWHLNANEHGLLLQPQGGVGFIRTFRKPREEQDINVPEKPERPLPNSSFPQSAEEKVWRFFYDLKGSAEFPFRGGVFQWARFRENGTGLAERERIYSQSLREHEGALTLATLRIFGNHLGQPHFHSNANEMGVVLSGCGQAGLSLPNSSLSFPVGIGDVVFFPAGSQHFLQSFCQEDLLLVLAYSTNRQLQTLRMEQYFHGIPEQVLAQVFHKEPAEFQKIPKD